MSTTSLPVGRSWVWAKYTSADGQRTLISSYASFNVSGPLTLQIDYSSQYTRSDPPQPLVSLALADGTPVASSGPAQAPAATAKAKATVRVRPALPAGYTSMEEFERASPLWSYPVLTTGYLDYLTPLTPLYPTTPRDSVGLTCGFQATSMLVPAGPLVNYTLPQPTGTLRIQENGVTLREVPASSIGSTRDLFPALPEGHHTLTISYSGDSVFGAASETISFDIARTPVTVSVTPSSTRISQGNPFSVAVSVSTQEMARIAPSGRVWLYVDGERVRRIRLGSREAISLNLTRGRHSIYATYAGDDNCLPATSQAVTVRVRSNTPPVGQFAVDSAGRLTGWAYDPERPGESLRVYLTVDGQRYALFMASSPTPRAAGLDSQWQNNGLAEDLPSMPGGRHVVRAYVVDPATDALVQVGGDMWVNGFIRFKA